MALVLGLSGNFVALILFFFVLASLFLQTHAASRGLSGTQNVEAEPSVVGLCASSITVHGYKCHELEVITGDGYILSVQRIPEGRAEVNGSQIKKQPVIIQHGVMVDGMTWLHNSPEQNLPLILADSGFDVWIVNSRGTRYSRRHTTLHTSSPTYWNWSFDEMVTYDLPAVFDYVSNQTGGQKIDYVGHSLGTLVALASFSEGKLVNQLKSAALLSPVAYLSHMKTALGVVAADSFLGEILATAGVKEFDPKGYDVTNAVKILCLYPGVDCRDLLTAITGDNCCLDRTTVELFLMNEPQPTSTKNMMHLSQIVRSRVVAKFKTGLASPPIYNLSNIPHDLPLFLSYGGEDALSDVEDVKTLLDHLKFHDADKLRVQFIKEYAHGDYIMGNNAKDLVFSAVTSFFKIKF